MQAEPCVIQSCCFPSDSEDTYLVGGTLSLVKDIDWSVGHHDFSVGHNYEVFLTHSCFKS